MDKAKAARAIEEFLRALGRDPAREPELVGTGARVASAFGDELLDGYDADPDRVVRENVIAGGGELVVVRDLAVTTVCPHHLMPATGTGVVAIATRQKLVGVGAIGELVDALTHRLTLAEVAAQRVVETLARHLEPRWVACRLALAHSCMTARGAREHQARVDTVAIAGGEIDRELAYRALGVGV